MRSNCLIFALCQWYKNGGYLVVRKSRWGWWPHFLWSADLKSFEQFAPTNPVHKKFPPFLFKGSIKIGDDDA